ncbi:hypothetical protein IEO21_08893 [Rhodonia placenta]|uniref:Uncharacterized protein n=1 Tax=Rhodonia placenta TaxID=104341 RepID=A0A8H7TYS6_9APHY|nr:hypothetical protein IEO21_08893 [Postia placenta]
MDVLHQFRTACETARTTEEGVIDRLEADRADAGAEAARARRYKEERLVARAQEEGRQQGFQEGLARGRDIGYYEAREQFELNATTAQQCRFEFNLRSNICNASRSCGKASITSEFVDFCKVHSCNGLADANDNVRKAVMPLKQDGMHQRLLVDLLAKLVVLVTFDGVAIYGKPTFLIGTHAGIYMPTFLPSFREISGTFTR